MIEKRNVIERIALFLAVGVSIFWIGYGIKVMIDYNILFEPISDTVRQYCIIFTSTLIIIIIISWLLVEIKTRKGC